MNAQQQTLVKVAQEMDQLARRYNETEDEKKEDIKTINLEADALLVELVRALGTEHRNLIEAIIHDYNVIDWPED